MKIHRYDVCLAQLDPTLGREMKKTRPVVVVSQEPMNRYSDTVVVCPLTTKLHPQWRSRIQIRCAGKPAEVAVDQIRTISKQRLIKKIDCLADEVSEQLRNIIEELSKKAMAVS